MFGEQGKVLQGKLCFFVLFRVALLIGKDYNFLNFKIGIGSLLKHLYGLINLTTWCRYCLSRYSYIQKI